MSVVYFISDGEYIKIGQSVNVYTRIADLQCSNARTLTILHTVECPAGYDGTLEAMFHLHFKGQHVRGEWFNLDWETAKHEIAAIESEISEPIRQHIEQKEEYERKRALEKLQARFDNLVSEDIAQNYPRMKHPKRSLFGKRVEGDDNAILGINFQSRFRESG